MRSLSGLSIIVRRIWPQTTNGFTLPGEIRLCASPHRPVKSLTCVFHMCVFALTNAHAERLIGTLAHIIILNDFSLKRILKTYLQYYEHSRIPLSFRERRAGLPSCSAPRVGSSDRATAGGRHFRGRRGRCLADTDLTMVERLGAARNADS